MLSLELLQQPQVAVFSDSVPKENPASVRCSSPDSTLRIVEQSHLDPNHDNATKINDNAKPEIKATIHISCVDCKDFKGKRDWQGRIIGNGIHGFLNALFTRIKHKNKLLRRNTPLIHVLTICDDCCSGLDLYHEADQIDKIHSFGGINKTSGSLVLSLSYKEIEEVASSKAIIMEGVLMNSIKTVGIDGHCKEWSLLNKPK